MKVETFAEQMLFLTLRIETQELIGTGFLVSHEWSDRASGEQLTGLFLVSNKHVVGDSTGGRITFARKTVDGSDRRDSPYLVNVDAGNWGWFMHPSDDVDVAALPLSPIFNSMEDKGDSVLFKRLPTASFPNADALDELDALEEVVFVGYPNNVYDRANNLPIFRRGITATPPNVDYEAKPKFLIDASVFPGSSGSPVFIYNVGPWRQRSGDIAFGGSPRVVFLGVLAAVLYREEDGTLEFAEIPASVAAMVKTRQMIDLGVVYKARTVLETIEHGLRHAGLIE